MSGSGELTVRINRRAAVLGGVVVGAVIVLPSILLVYIVGARLTGLLDKVEEVVESWRGEVELVGARGERHLSLDVGGVAGEVALGDGASFRAFAVSARPELCAATLVHSGPDGTLVVGTYQVGERVPAPDAGGEEFWLVEVRSVDGSSACGGNVVPPELRDPTPEATRGWDRQSRLEMGREVAWPR